MPKFSISRSQVIDCPVEKVFEIVRDFGNWPKWSPWLIADQECQLQVQDDWYSWEGEICGAGRMDVIDAVENESINYELNFLKPFKSQAEVKMAYRRDREKTEVTWTMKSSFPFFLFWMKKSMMAFIGMDYERGLLMLKDLAETGEVPSHLEFPGREPSPSFVGVGIRGTANLDCFENEMGENLEKVRKHYPEGEGFSVYYEWDVVKGSMTYLIGVKLETTPGVIPDGMELVRTPGMEVYVVRHRGADRHLGNAWAAGMMHGRSKQFKHSKKFPPFEIYEEESGKDPVVKICLPMK